MEETTIDLKDVIRILKKRKGMILKLFFGFLVAALAVSLVRPPTYEGESALRVKQKKGLGDSLLGDLPTGNSSATKQLMSTYAEILKSRTVVNALIEEMYGDKPEDEKPTYEAMLKRITTQPVKDTEILKVKVTAKDPQEAAQLTDTLVAIFNGRLTELVRTEQRAVRGFIGDRLGDSRKELEQAETALEKYKSEQKILAPEEETKAFVDKIADLDKLSATNKVAVSAAQAKLSATEGQLAGQNAGFIGDNLTVQKYRDNLVEQEVKLVELTQRYTEKHPEVIMTRKKIKEIRQGLQTEIQAVASNRAPSANPVYMGLLTERMQGEAELAAAAAQQQAIEKALAEGETDMAKLPAKERGYVRLLRDATVAQEIYVMLAKRHEEARIAEVMEATDVQLVDKAVVPDKPIKPKPFLNTLIGALLGLFAGLGAAFILEYLNRSIRTDEDVQRYLGVPVLGRIPEVDRLGEKERGEAQAFLKKLLQLGRKGKE